MRAWKVQKLFGDVVYDLRNRGLLPVVILLLIAMIAVPILLSRGGSSSGSAIQTTAAPVKPAPEGERAVVSYNPPGLRNYKQRLSDQAAKNPFRINLPPASAAKSSQVTSTATVSSTATGSTSSSTVTAGPPSAPGTVTGHSGKPRLVYFHSVADLSFGDTSQPLVRHRRMQAFGSLPTQEAPVLIYLGSSLSGKHAYFSVSTYDSQIMGPGICVPGPTDCSLLLLSPGQTETMVYSGDGKTYGVTVNKISLAVTKKPPAS